jgi:hypothetical protein
MVFDRDRPDLPILKENYHLLGHEARHPVDARASLLYSQESANLSLLVLDQETQHRAAPPQGGAGHVLFLVPLGGGPADDLGSAPLFIR